MKRLLLSLLIACLGAIGLLALLSWRVNDALNPIVDPHRYAEVVAERQQSAPSYYRFLPGAIPVEAEAVSFLHQPGFLQGGDTITLRLRLPKAQTEALLVALEQSGRSEATNNQLLGRERCYPRFGAKRRDVVKQFSENVTELPADFRIFLHRTDLKDVEKNWNHNFIAFTAVSTNRSEVVYHVDNW